MLARPEFKNAMHRHLLTPEAPQDASPFFTMLKPVFR
jgi:hypothetical protein